MDDALRPLRMPSAMPVLDYLLRLALLLANRSFVRICHFRMFGCSLGLHHPIGKGVKGIEKTCSCFRI